MAPAAPGTAAEEDPQVLAALKLKEEQRKAAHARYMRFSRSLKSCSLSLVVGRAVRGFGCRALLDLEIIDL